MELARGPEERGEGEVVPEVKPVGGKDEVLVIVTRGSDPPAECVVEKIESQLEESQIEESQIAENQLAESQLAESQLEESQLAENQLEEIKLAESQQEERQLAKSQLEESPLEESKLAESKLAESQQEERQLAKSQLEESPLEESSRDQDDHHQDQAVHVQTSADLVTAAAAPEEPVEIPAPSTEGLQGEKNDVTVQESISEEEDEEEEDGEEEEDDSEPDSSRETTPPAPRPAPPVARVSVWARPHLAHQIVVPARLVEARLVEVRLGRLGPLRQSLRKAGRRLSAAWRLITCRGGV